MRVRLLALFMALAAGPLDAALEKWGNGSRFGAMAFGQSTAQEPPRSWQFSLSLVF